MWLSANRDLIASRVKEWVEDFSGVVKFLANHITFVTRAIGFYIGALIALKVGTLICKLVTIGMTVATWSLTLATDLASISQNGLMLATLQGTAALKLCTAWIWLTSAATWAWAAALWATGIPEIILGIIAIGAALYFTIKYWDQITESVNKFSDTGIGAILGLITPIASIIRLISFMQQRWDGITSAFNDGGFLHGIMAIGNALMSFVLQPIQAILKAVGEVTGAAWATNLSSSIGNLRGFLDKGLVAEKPVNKDASILTQKKILETNSSQNVQINIDDATGRARLGGNTAPIPVFINNTKGFEWYGSTNK